MSLRSWIVSRRSQLREPGNGCRTSSSSLHSFRTPDNSRVYLGSGCSRYCPILTSSFTKRCRPRSSSTPSGTPPEPRPTGPTDEGIRQAGARRVRKPARRDGGPRERHRLAGGDPHGPAKRQFRHQGRYHGLFLPRERRRAEGDGRHGSSSRYADRGQWEGIHGAGDV